MGAFIEALEAGAYYEAHEHLEGLWLRHRSLRTPEIVLIKGYINAAVSFELERLGRIAAAQTPWKTFEKYLPQRTYVDEALRPHFEMGYRAIAAVKCLHVRAFALKFPIEKGMYLNQKGTS